MISEIDPAAAPESNPTGADASAAAAPQAIAARSPAASITIATGAIVWLFVAVLLLCDFIFNAANVGSSKDPFTTFISSASSVLSAPFDAFFQTSYASNGALFVWADILAIGIYSLASLGLLLVVGQKWRPLVKVGVIAGVGIVAALIGYLFGFQVQLYGYAVESNPLVGATVNVYAMNGNGQTSALLATTVTDENGFYAVKVRRPPTDSLLVMTSGGTYVDQITQKPITAGRNDSLRSAVTPGRNRVPLNPLTTFATTRASSLAASGRPLGASIEISYAAVARQFNLDTITDHDAATALTVQQAGRTPREIGLILAGLDEQANTLGVTDIALTDAIALDLSDGNLDGKDGQTPIPIDASHPLPADAATTQLQSAINTFAASPDNVTHLGPPQIATTSPHIDLNSAGFYVASNALPAWIAGQPGSSTLSAIGGTSPYSCALTGGSLPAGFSLSGACTISGTGELLGGSVESFSPPFTVSMTDASSPALSASVELRITIIQKPPTINVVSGNCPDTVTVCAIKIASGGGGTPPYYFTDSVLGGFPPLGMILHLDGTLSGTPASVGSYTFDVCVVDLVGGEACTTTSVTVGTVQPPPAPPANLPAGFPTNLPPGDYNLQICPAGQGSCIDGGTKTLSSNEIASFAKAISDAVNQLNSACSGDCSAQYSAFDGSSFVVTITAQACSGGSCATTSGKLQVTKVG